VRCGNRLGSGQNLAPGKTMMAKLMGKLLHMMGVVQNDKFSETPG